MAVFGNPIGNGLAAAAQVFAPAQFGPIVGPQGLDPWGLAFNNGLAPIPSPVQVFNGVGNAIGLPTLWNPAGAQGAPFMGPTGGGAAGAIAGAGVAGAGALAALLGPVGGIGVGALLLLLIVGAIILVPLFSGLITGTSTSTTGLPSGTLLLLILLGVLLFAGSGGGGGGIGGQGQDWTFMVILLLVALAAVGLAGGNSLSSLLGLAG